MRPGSKVDCMEGQPPENWGLGKAHHQITGDWLRGSGRGFSLVSMQERLCATQPGVRDPLKKRT